MLHWTWFSPIHYFFVHGKRGTECQAYHVNLMVQFERLEPNMITVEVDPPK